MFINVSIQHLKVIMEKAAMMVLQLRTAGKSTITNIQEMELPDLFVALIVM